MPHQITRTHEIDAGHRVAGHEGKCAHLHGHRYRIAFTCEAIDGSLDALGRVVDFSVLKTRLCQWLEDNWDHRMLLWQHDPLRPAIRKMDPHGVCTTSFNPTAENMARWLVETLGPEALRGTGVRLAACTVHETAKCSASYTAASSQPPAAFVQQPLGDNVAQHADSQEAAIA